MGEERTLVDVHQVITAMLAEGYQLSTLTPKVVIEYAVAKKLGEFSRSSVSVSLCHRRAFENNETPI